MRSVSPTICFAAALIITSGSFCRGQNSSPSSVTISPSPLPGQSAVGMVVGQRAMFSATLTPQKKCSGFSWTSSASAALHIPFTVGGIVDALRRGSTTLTALEVFSNQSSSVTVFASADQYFWSDNSSELQSILNEFPKFWKYDGVVFEFSSSSNDLAGNPDPALVPLWR